MDNSFNPNTLTHQDTSTPDRVEKYGIKKARVLVPEIVPTGGDASLHPYCFQLISARVLSTSDSILPPVGASQGTKVLSPFRGSISTPYLCRSLRSAR